MSGQNNSTPSTAEARRDSASPPQPIRAHSLLKNVGKRQWIPAALVARPELTPLDKLIWSRLARYEGKTGVARPKLSTLAREVGVSRAQAQRSVAHLVQLKLLSVVVKKWQHRPNEYHFLAHEWLQNGPFRNPPVNFAKPTGELRDVSQANFAKFAGDMSRCITGEHPLNRVNEESQFKLFDPPAAPLDQRVAKTKQKTSPTKKPKEQKPLKPPKPPKPVDTEHQKAIDACVREFEAYTEKKYSFSPRDAKAVQLMRKVADAEAIAKAWAKAIRHAGYPQVAAIWQLQAHWNFFSLGEKQQPIQRLKLTRAQEIDNVDWAKEEEKWAIPAK